MLLTHTLQSTLKFKHEIHAVMLQRFVTQELYSLGASHRYHLVIIQLVQITYCPQVVVLVTQVDYLCRLFCVDCTLLSMAKKHLQRSSIPLSLLLMLKIYQHMVKQ